LVSKSKLRVSFDQPPQGNQNYLLNAADTPASQPWGLDWISISDCNLALAYLPDI
jgi:hypothetical protein